ncbi:hypothetical protein N0V91_009905 [Didymella pomorum]|uniref:Actin-like ATPase domain-containing protein n=1 Tax=Didymella pomorum TaxID=749634 RepID=A0A9W8Z6F2_9PLEO|nr:hypothetical protein N0V91_009905 [Didymella pomorum]
MATEIVVGIDFGTTYSGVSWAINGGEKKIHIVNDWPNPNASVANSDKVASKISYQNWKAKNWGFNVELKEQSLSWFKLLLDPNNKIGQGSDKVVDTLRQLEALNKAPEDVSVDYLSKLWQYTKDKISKVRGEDWTDIYTVRAVLTVPAIWSDSAKDRTLRIAKRAGIPDNVSLVSEPEAAALAVLREKKEEGEPLRIGDCFVVCDAGGGTVDLISYKISSLEPFQVEECAMGAGDLCGSVYLDQAFERYIRLIVGESQWKQLKPKSKQKMMLDFENSIKRSYAGDDKQFTVDLQGVEDNASVGIDDETITLKSNALKTIFDHVIGQILRLVENQVAEVEEKGNHVKAILLVGGFGTNRYLYKQLNHAYQTVRVLQATGGSENSVKVLCKVDFAIDRAKLWAEKSFKDPATGQKWRTALFDFGIRLDDTTLDFFVTYKGEEVASVAANYMEEF